jgi:hypothetical protein
LRGARIEQRASEQAAKLVRINARVDGEPVVGSSEQRASQLGSRMRTEA